jgi:ABC-type Fe3+ transport system permease subunit
LLFAFAPAFPLVWLIITEGSPSTQGLLGSGFGLAILYSLSVAGAVALLSTFFGILAGLLAGLYDFPGRRVLLALLAIPLLVPSFLWAIGLSQLRIHLGLPSESFLSGWSGTVLAFSAPAFSLVLYMTLVSVRRLSKSQVESVRLVDDESLIFRYAARAVLPAASLTGVLAGILTLSDPGPGQILGFSGVPYEILLSRS